MQAAPRPFDLLASASAIRVGYASRDWSRSSAGHPDTWGPVLRSSVGMILDSRFPMFIAWGPELALLYNHAYVELLEAKHPAALGSPLRAVWPQLWDGVQPLVEQALAGQPTYGEDVPRMIVRNGQPFEGRFTLAYSPLRDESGAVAGALCVINETTDRVALEKRQALQLQLVDRLSGLADPEQILATANDMLGQFLDVSHVFHGVIDDASGHFRIRAGWSREGGGELAGTEGCLDDFGPEVVRDLRAGLPLVVEDVVVDPRTAPHAQAYLDLGIRALMAQPLAREGRLLASVNVHDDKPRRWSGEQRKLAADIAERAWAALDRAQAETALREGAGRQAALLAILEFQLDLADQLRRLDQAGQIMGRTSALLGRFLGARRVVYGDYDAEQRSITFHSNYVDGLAPLEGSFPTDAFGRENLLSLGTGATWVADDLALDPRTGGADTWPLFEALGIRSGVAAPLNRRGALTSSLFVHHDQPRHWSVDEVRVIADAAERAWSAIERVRAEEALRAADRRKDEFLAMLAHELRNPLAPIAAAAQLLNMGQVDAARIARTSGIIARQVAHMTGLIDDLLDVSRVTRGLAVLQNAPVDLKRVVADAAEQVRPLVEARRHALALHLAAEPAFVEGDHKRLVQVLANLLNNAAKYTPEGGRLNLAMTVTPEQVAIVVGDNGIGIDPGLLSTVFELFAQAERTPDRAQGGLGLGLALVKSLVELHGGSVAADSGGDETGSRFTVRLPRRAAPVAASGDTPAVLAPAPAAGLDVLVVDDNVDAAATIAMLLESSGYRVTVLHDPKRALLAAQSGRFDACVLDIGLPGMDGHELARRLRALPGTANALMLALTGYGQRETAPHANPAFDHFMVKPADPARLFALLAQGAGPDRAGA
ncbi:ATP-binding protein [Massilia sp.]|uniref:hybrid sensor histidine kinase/response regulator n=1 Tax=Massilia sp. TaxID=1882437 RepID=UPI0028AE79FA|nr:ATP-binding protein [Massilia sp.]